METWLLLGALVYFAWESRAMAVTVPATIREAQKKARAEWPRRHLVDELKKLADELGLYPEFLWAMCQVESGFDAGAVNLAGTDGARGGAFGPLQMTLKTARAFAGKLGRDRIDAVDLLDPAFNLAVCRELLLELRGPVDNKRKQRDIAAMWNSGKPLAQAPQKTVAYVEKIRQLMDEYRDRPPEA
jgi:hypothetical protein